jgi:hypothetical protein
LAEHGQAIDTDIAPFSRHVAGSRVEPLSPVRRYRTVVCQQRVTVLPMRRSANSVAWQVCAGV